jgi:TM2 domain-containing membrane protein YozV
MTTNANGKNAVAAYLLWFFLGGFGAHRFYMGRNGSAFGMLGLWLASAVLTTVLIGFVGFLALGVWWIVDAFLINTWLQQDSAGVAGVIDPAPDQQADAA